MQGRSTNRGESETLPLILLACALLLKLSDAESDLKVLHCTVQHTAAARRSFSPHIFEKHLLLQRGGGGGGWGLARAEGSRLDWPEELLGAECSDYTEEAHAAGDLAPVILSL